MKTITKTFKLQALVLVAVFFFTSLAVEASHFRYMSVNWEITSSTSTTRTVQFNITQSWRRSAWFGGGSAIGLTFTPTAFYYGDGSYNYPTLTVTSENTTEDWIVGTATITKVYNTTSDVTAYIGSCCRIGELLEGQANDDFRVETKVTLSNLSNKSPVTNSPPIFYVQKDLPAATIQLNAFDPDGDPLTFSLANTAQSGLSPAVPSIVTSLSSTGLLELNTQSKSEDDKYAMQARVSDDQGAFVPLDFIVQIVGISTPPQFDYAITPADGSTIKVQPGTPISFKVNAFDTDALSTVTLNASGVPLGAAVTIQTGDNNPGNPAQFTFDWTPTIADLGSYAMSFSATDNILVQTISNVNLIVSLAPIFDVPPTPDPVIHNVLAPGTNLAFTAQATDPDPLDVVQIISAKHKMTNADFTTLGATIPLPSAAANTTSTTFSWTPTQAQWGHNHVIFTAEDSYGDQTEHEVSILVNTTPAITSTPVTSVIATQPYSYLFTGSDPDVAYGDILKVVSTLALPSWLSLVDNGDGTALLSGNPSLLDAGTHTIELQLEDLNHHINLGGIPTQSFDIIVIPCLIEINETVTDLTCPGDNSGAINITLTGNYGTPTFAWTGPNGFTATSEDVSGLEAGAYSVIVTSDLGCSETKSFTVGTTPDVTPPTITCPAPISVANDPGVCGAAVCYAAPVASDNCTPVTPAGYSYIASYGNSYYYMRNATTDYATAEAEAAAAGGHLAVITSAAENDAIDAGGGTFSYIGGNDLDNEGTFVWSNCETYSYSNFAGSEPNGGTGENYIEFMGGGFWNDISGSNARYAIMEIEGASIVQTAGFPTNSVFPVGTTTNTFVVTDASGNTDTCSFDVTVEDNEMPILTAISTPITLWPPNHKYETIDMSQMFASVSDNCGVLSSDDVYITSVSSDELENGSGDGNTVDDIVIDSECGSVDLRKERSGNSNGRVYTIYLAVDDGNGNTGTASCQVHVPHSKNGTAIDDGMAYEELCGNKSSFIASAGDEVKLMNYPNPFTGSTNIKFTLTEANNTTLKVYDTFGKVVATLYEGMVESGQEYNFEFTSGSLSKGVYIYHLQSGNDVNVLKKMILMK